MMAFALEREVFYESHIEVAQAWLAAAVATGWTVDVEGAIVEVVGVVLRVKADERCVRQA
jgi:hypothetical protein